MKQQKIRCSWPNGKDEDVKYHDTEWGVPLYDDQKLFEFIILDGFQAGLNWSMILKKRENFRKAFDNFDAVKIASYDEDKVKQLIQDAGIIRNKLKIYATINNAKIFLETQKEFGSFKNYIWQFTTGVTLKNQWESMSEIPVSTPESDAMSKDLKKRGFKFVGTTICYAFMQAAGMVNDHVVSCYRYNEVGENQNNNYMSFRAGNLR